jgi:hypothetical protein
MKRIRRCREQMNQEIRENIGCRWRGDIRPEHGKRDAGYTESHRAYHTWDHAAGLLEKLSEFSDLSTRSDIIAVSVFWHDVVYRTSQDGSPRPDYENVRDSGELFRQYTLFTKSDADAVYDLNPAFVIRHISVAEGTLSLSLLETVGRLRIRGLGCGRREAVPRPCDRSLLSASPSEHHR